MYFLTTKCCLKRIPVFIPDNFYVILWKLIILIFLILYFFAIPLKASFKEVNFKDELMVYLFFYIPLPFFILDIVRCFNTGYYEDGILQKSRKKIALKYTRFHFFLDLLTTLSIIFTNYLEDGSIIYLVIMLRIVRLKELLEEITKHFQVEERFPNTFILSRLMALIIFVAHFAGCGFHYVAILEAENDKRTWLHKAGIENEDWDVRYTSTLYFSVITMITGKNIV